MNINLLPVTGLPLPLISYGGSALMTILAAMGLVQSVILRHRKIEF
jgi:rod shape determining protein RodA